MKRQIRVHVNNVFQFTVRVGQDEELETVAETARRVMRLGDNLKAHVSPGQINFIPKSVKP